MAEPSDANPWGDATPSHARPSRARARRRITRRNPPPPPDDAWADYVPDDDPPAWADPIEAW